MTEPFRLRRPSARKSSAREALVSSASNEAYTPPHIVEAARYALGGRIDLDPCSNAIANEEVRAVRYFTAEDRGLRRVWFPDEPGTAYVNPPGGFLDGNLEPSTRGLSSACAWWYTTLDHYRAGSLVAGVYYVFRLDVLQNIQEEEGYPPPQAFPFCIFGERPRHWNKDTPAHLRGQKGQPTHACGAFFLPERWIGGSLQLSHSDALKTPERFGQPVRAADYFPITPENSALACGSLPSDAPWGFHGPSVDRFREAFSPLGYVRI